MDSYSLSLFEARESAVAFQRMPSLTYGTRIKHPSQGLLSSNHHARYGNSIQLSHPTVPSFISPGPCPPLDHALLFPNSSSVGSSSSYSIPSAQGTSSNLPVDDDHIGLYQDTGITTGRYLDVISVANKQYTASEGEIVDDPIHSQQIEFRVTGEANQDADHRRSFTILPDSGFQPRTFKKTVTTSAIRRASDARKKLKSLNSDAKSTCNICSQIFTTKVGLRSTSLLSSS